MRISDWSSDVCSSDLAALRGLRQAQGPRGCHAEGAMLLLHRLTIVRRARVNVLRRNSGRRARPRRKVPGPRARSRPQRSEEHTSELQSLMRISYAVFCLKKKKQKKTKSRNIKTSRITYNKKI